MATTDDLESRVNGLSYDHLVEAANFYLPDTVGTADLENVESLLAEQVKERGGEYDELVRRLREIGGDEQSVEYMLRATLLGAAKGTAEEKRRLEEALDGVGKSLVIVEVIFAIYAATSLGMFWLLKPPVKTKTVRKRTEDSTGKVTIEETEMSEEIPPPVEKLFGWIKDLPGLGGGRNKTK